MSFDIAVTNIGIRIDNLNKYSDDKVRIKSDLDRITKDIARLYDEYVIAGGNIAKVESLNTRVESFKNQFETPTSLFVIAKSEFFQSSKL